MSRQKGSKNKKVAKEKRVETTPKIKATLKIFGKFYVAEGNTVLEAITNLKPEGWRGVSVLALERGNIRKERILGRPVTARLFGLSGGTVKAVVLQEVATLFEGIF